MAVLIDDWSFTDAIFYNKISHFRFMQFLPGFHSPILKMTDSVKFSVKKRNRIIEVSVPKYKRISSHTGRRTYITLALEQGVRLDILMKTTGHKKFDTMNKYTKITDTTVNEEFLGKIKLKPQTD